MGKKRKKPFSRPRKNTINLDKVRDTSSTAEEERLSTYYQGEYKDSEKVSAPFRGEKGKPESEAIISYRVIGLIVAIVGIVGTAIWVVSGMNSDVNNVKDGLKTVKEKTEKLAESFVSQEVRITNIDKNLGEINSEIRELNNKIYESLE